MAIVGILFFLLLAGCQSVQKRNGIKEGTPRPTSQDLVSKLGLDTSMDRPMASYSGAYPLKELDVVDMKGRHVSMEAYRGRWVLVDFFTTYAVPSQDTIPQLNALQKKYARSGLVVVGVSLDLQGRVMVKPFIELLEIEYPIYIAINETKEGKTPYGFIQEIPVTLLIDPKGNMVNGYLGLVDQGTIEKDLKRYLPKY